MIHVAAAIIRRNGRLLLCRRGPGGSCAHLWEFPGGKLEPGEDAAAAAARECREELGVVLRLGPLYAECRHRYPDREVGIRFFLAEIADGEPRRTVHEELRWAAPQELSQFEFCPADAELVPRLALELTGAEGEEGKRQGGV